MKAIVSVLSDGKTGKKGESSHPLPKLGGHLNMFPSKKMKICSLLVEKTQNAFGSTFVGPSLSQK